MFIQAIRIYFQPSSNELDNKSQFIRQDNIERLYYSEEFTGIIGVMGEDHYLLKDTVCSLGQVWDKLTPEV